MPIFKTGNFYFQDMHHGDIPHNSPFSNIIGLFKESFLILAEKTMTRFATAEKTLWHAPPVINCTFPVGYLWPQFGTSWMRISIIFKLSVVQSTYQRLEEIVQVWSSNSVVIASSCVFHLALSMLEWNHTIYKCLCICEWSSISILSKNNYSQTNSWYKKYFLW